MIIFSFRDSDYFLYKESGYWMKMNDCSFKALLP